MQNKRHVLMDRYEKAIRAHENREGKPKDVQFSIDAELGEARKSVRDALDYLVKTPSNSTR